MCTEHTVGLQLEQGLGEVSVRSGCGLSLPNSRARGTVDPFGGSIFRFRCIVQWEQVYRATMETGVQSNQQKLSTGFLVRGVKSVLAGEPSGNPGTILPSLRLTPSQESESKANQDCRGIAETSATVKGLGDKGVAIPITALATCTFGQSKGQMDDEE